MSIPTERGALQVAAPTALPVSQDDEPEKFDTLTAAYFSGFHNGRKHAAEFATPQPAEQPVIIKIMERQIKTCMEIIDKRDAEIAELKAQIAQPEQTAPAGSTGLYYACDLYINGVYQPPNRPELSAAQIYAIHLRECKGCTHTSSEEVLRFARAVLAAAKEKKS